MDIDGTGQPSEPDWLSEERPPWSTADYWEQDHPDDHRHESDSIDVPVVLLMRRADRKRHRIVREKHADLFSITAYQYLQDPEIWVALAGDDTGLTLSLESARRLKHELASFLRKNFGNS